MIQSIERTSAPVRSAYKQKISAGIEDVPVKAKNGSMGMLSDYVGITETVPIFCPFHDDRNPSAFVVPNKEINNVGVHCSSSNCSTGGVTQWLKKL